MTELEALIPNLLAKTLPLSKNCDNTVPWSSVPTPPGWRPQRVSLAEPHEALVHTAKLSQRNDPRDHHRPDRPGGTQISFNARYNAENP